MDFIVQLPKSNDGHDAILVFIDKLTKMVHLAPTTTEVTARGTARLFFDHIFRLHGMPTSIISDRNSRFTSAFWKNLFQMVGTELSMSTAFHPQTDGQTERTNRTVEDMLRSYCDDHQRNWDTLLTPVEFAINNASQASTGSSPFFLNYGRHPTVPSALHTGLKQPSDSPSADTFISEMHTALLDAKTRLQQAQQRQKSAADRHRTPHTFTVGDRVLLSVEHLHLAGLGSRKLAPRFCGPFKILELIGPNAVRIELHAECKFHDVINISRLKPFVEGDTVTYPGRELFLPPPPHTIAGEEHFKVHAFLKSRHKGRGRKLEYLVRWEGYPPSYDAWIPDKQLKEDLDPTSFAEFVDNMKAATT